MNTQFTPFDDSWKKSVMKLPKSAIVDMYRKTCQQKLDMSEVILNLEYQTRILREFANNAAKTSSSTRLRRLANEAIANVKGSK